MPELMVTEDRGFYCGGGVHAALDLGLYLVEKFCGHEVAMQSAKAVLRDRRFGDLLAPGGVVRRSGIWQHAFGTNPDLIQFDEHPPSDIRKVTCSTPTPPFSHPDWIFEVKWDGFRALLHSDSDGVRLVSRNGNTFKSFPRLCEDLARDLNGRRCVLDGEIVSLDIHGKPQFRDLLFRRAEPLFYAFDIL
jgi:hypothetical protein